MEYTREQLLAQLRRLEAENRELTHRLLQTTMEKAISDDRASQELSRQIAQFYPEAPSPWFLLLLFFGRLPENGPENAPEAGPKSMPESMPQNSPAMENPAVQVARDYTPVLSGFGQTFYFSPQGCVACLLNLHGALLAGADGEKRQALAEQVRAALLDTIRPDGSTAYICMSRIRDFSDGPRRLYRDASVAAEYRTEQSQPVSVEWELPDEPRQAPGNVYRLELLFWQQLQRRTFYDAAGTLDKIVEFTRYQQGSLERTQGVIFSRLETVFQSIGQEMGTDIMQDPDFSALMPQLTRAENYHALRDTTHDILALLEDKFYTPPGGRNRKMEAIEAYIRTHFREQSLGAAAISEEFKISTSYLSRIFRADQGMSVVDYIHAVRVAEAKKLLRTTDLTVSEIAGQVGFSTHWVFIRAFKRQTGLTPGAFRAT